MDQTVESADKAARHAEVVRETLFTKIFQAGFRSRRAFAKKIGCSPSTLDRYHSGATGIPSWEIWLRIFAVLPEMRALVAPEATRVRPIALPRPPEPGGGILIRAQVAAGLWQPSFDLPPTKQLRVSLPVAAETIERGAFGVVLREPGAELLHAAGSILVCEPSDGFGEDLQNRQVIVQRTNKRGRIEVTLRVVEISDKVDALLEMKTTHPDHRTPLRMPYHHTAPRWRWSVDDDLYYIAGVVFWHDGPVRR